jgi:hypothetical protein
MIGIPVYSEEYSFPTLFILILESNVPLMQNVHMTSEHSDDIAATNKVWYNREAKQGYSNSVQCF